MIVLQQDVFNVLRIDSDVFEIGSAQHAPLEDGCAIIGHEATTMGSPILNRQKSAARTKAIRRYGFECIMLLRVGTLFVPR